MNKYIYYVAQYIASVSDVLSQSSIVRNVTDTKGKSACLTDRDSFLKVAEN